MALLLQEVQLGYLGKTSQRNHLAVLNWIVNNKPFGEGKYDFIYHTQDYVSAAKPAGRFENIIEAYLDNFNESRLKVR